MGRRRRNTGHSVESADVPMPTCARSGATSPRRTFRTWGAGAGGAAARGARRLRFAGRGEEEPQGRDRAGRRGSQHPPIAADATSTRKFPPPISRARFAQSVTREAERARAGEARGARAGEAAVGRCLRARSARASARPDGGGPGGASGGPMLIRHWRSASKRCLQALGCAFLPGALWARLIFTSASQRAAPCLGDSRQCPAPHSPSVQAPPSGAILSAALALAPAAASARTTCSTRATSRSFPWNQLATHHLGAFSGFRRARSDFAGRSAASSVSVSFPRCAQPDGLGG